MAVVNTHLKEVEGINSNRGNASTKRVAITIDASEMAMGAAADVVKLLTLPVGAIVDGAYIDVLTVDSAAADVNVVMSAGDATGDTLIDGASLTTLGVKADGTNALKTRQIVTGAAVWYIKLTAITNAITDGVFRLVIQYTHPQNRVIEGGQAAPGHEQ